MSESKIEWTDRSDWNPIRGCARVSAGCENCYAERQAHRFSGPEKPFDGLTRLTSRGPQWTGRVELVPERLDLPLRWRKPARIFVCSMSDPFHEDVPDEFLDQMFGVMSVAEAHTFQLLTKRPKRMREWFARWDDGRASRALFGARLPLPNVWLGVSVENQAAAEERIPELLATPAAVRFVSAEPLLGAIDFNRSIGGTLWIGGHRGCGATHTGVGTPECPRQPHHHHDDRCERGLDWVIVGGESGPHARPCHVAWIRSIVEQCKAAGTACFVKQLGGHVRCTYGEWNSMPLPNQWTGDERIADKAALPKTTHMGRALLLDRKGGDPSEWPEDLRVREFPA